MPSHLLFERGELFLQGGCLFLQALDPLGVAVFFLSARLAEQADGQPAGEGHGQYCGEDKEQDAVEPAAFLQRFQALLCADGFAAAFLWVIAHGFSVAWLCGSKWQAHGWQCAAIRVWLALCVIAGSCLGVYAAAIGRVRACLAVKCATL
ncbi:hypothetical protein D3C86_1794480 [compost metagenome]